MFKFLEDLFAVIFGGKAVAPKEPKKPEEPVRGEPGWLKLARAEIGVKEVVGPQHNPTVLAYFRDAGFPEIDNDETAWCAGFANAMLERSGYAGSKSLAARSFLTWGKEITKPYPGCVAIFSRGDPRSWEGHVGFFVSQEGDKISVLGGNQSNQVSIAPQSKGRLLGYREPVKASNSRTMKASTLQVVKAGLDGAVILDSQEQLIGITDLLSKLGMTVPAYFVLSIVLSIALQCVIIWARADDAKKKGR